MLGAIIGDVVGSRFEFNNIKTKEFELITDKSTYTDDTVLTVAIMDWLLHAENRNGKNAAMYLRKWGRKYPNAGYGTRFVRWLHDDNAKAYNSCGNGSAMRISPVGWISNNLMEVAVMSFVATMITHNHPEGVKGADVTAKLICMARNGKSKEEMKAFAEKHYDINFDYNELVKNYYHGEETCQVTVPQALYCFFISNSFEDCLRTTVSIGGDTDTLCAISCAIAEAYYGQISAQLIEKVKEKLPSDMIKVIEEFKEKYGGQ